jgi:hypothetical protein
MALVQDDHVVQAVAADAANEPFHVGILPWALGANENLLNPHVSHPPPKGCAIDTVSITQQIPRRLVPRKGFYHLLSCPLRRGVFGDVEMDDAAPFMGQDE